MYAFMLIKITKYAYNYRNMLKYSYRILQKISIISINFLFKIKFQNVIESLSNGHSVECFWTSVSMKFSVSEQVFYLIWVFEQIF